MLTHRQRFNAASTSYDEVAIVQRQAAAYLVQQIRAYWPDFKPATVLDWGVGTGYLPELLRPYFLHSRFILNDLSVEMLLRTQNRLGESAQFSYYCADFDTAAFMPVDLLVSNLALQWSRDWLVTLRAGYLNSKRFAFSGLLEGTFQAWSAIFEACDIPSPVHPYASFAACEQALLALQPKEYHLFTQSVTLCFANAREVMRYLQRLGASFGHQALSVVQLKRVMQHTAPIELTYQLFFALLTRSD